MTHSACLLMAFSALAQTTRGQTCIDGICFVDSAAAGQIVLGNIRGSLAVLDYDNDGYPDLVVADNPGLPHRLFHDVASPSTPGGRTFVDVTAGSGLDDADGTARGGGGTVAADFDNDGDTDIFIMGRLTSNNSFGLLYRNNGNGTFTNVSVSAGMRFTGYVPDSVSWNDYDLDGYVDLLVCNLTGSIKRALLLRNNGNGTFTDVTELMLPSWPMPTHVYSHGWMDYDADGYTDGFILINQAAPVLLKNVDNGAGGRTFINSAATAGFTQLGPAPMGFAAGDYDGDGDLDLAITDAVVGTYYRNDGGSLTQFYPFATFFGWGVTWIDADNDGDLDNYQAGSWGAANVDRLHRNLGNGAFANISTALNTTSLASQYSVQIDFNNDGRQDLITINPGTPGQFISVYRNISTTPNHWLKVRLRGTGSINRDAIGAVVRLTAGGVTQVREVVSGSSTTATEDTRPHFGLGAGTSAERIEVLWPRTGAMPCRTEVFWGPFAADQIVTLAAGDGVIPGDLNDDGQITLADIDGFVTCLTGPGAMVAPGCNAANLRPDMVIDLRDAAALQRAFPCP
jgi:hypothetical protein